MKPFISLFVVLAVFALLWGHAAEQMTRPAAASTSPVALTPAAYEKLAEGMTPEEVIAAVGCDPVERNTDKSRATGATCEVMIWKDKARRVINVTFGNGRLIRKSEGNIYR